MDAQRFRKASTHWMRHTFVRQALIDEAPIEVVSELAGHANIATISIYSSQELARKIEAIRGGAQGGDSVMGAGCRHGLAVVG
ncbi:MAG: site-specific integrase [Bacteriovorax sp.]|nr:site-specific integrase [Rhizobacter sp.]